MSLSLQGKPEQIEIEQKRKKKRKLQDNLPEVHR